MRKFVFILLTPLIYSSIFSQNIYVEDRKLYVDNTEYRINGICYARGEEMEKTQVFLMQMIFTFGGS